MSDLRTCEVITEATEPPLISRKLLGAPGQQGAPEGRSTTAEAPNEQFLMTEEKGTLRNFSFLELVVQDFTFEAEKFVFVSNVVLV